MNVGRQRDTLHASLAVVRQERDEQTTQLAAATKEAAANRVRHSDASAAVREVEHKAEVAERARESAERRAAEFSRR